MQSRARKGITLFESVAALTIVGLVAISALEAVGAEMRTAERARRALEVEALATQRLDALELLNDQELQTIPDSSFEPTRPWVATPIWRTCLRLSRSGVSPNEGGGRSPALAPPPPRPYRPGPYRRQSW